VERKRGGPPAKGRGRLTTSEEGHRRAAQPKGRRSLSKKKKEGKKGKEEVHTMGPKDLK